MRPFYKLALLLGVVSVVSLQGHSAQEPGDSLAIASQTGSRAGQSGQPATIQLADTIVGYIIGNNQAALVSLFKDPDVNAWSTLYQRVTRQQFSTIDLVTLLDQTKTKILGNRGAIEYGPLAYHNVRAFLDTAMRQIFEGCWGISDEPVAAGVINHLKGVYGRIVSGLVTFDPNKQPDTAPVEALVKSLQAKKQDASPRVRAHLAALQECVAAVSYHVVKAALPVGVNEYDLAETVRTRLNKQTGASLTEASFEELLKIVRYQNPAYVAREIVHFFTLQAADPAAASSAAPLTIRQQQKKQLDLHKQGLEANFAIHKRIPEWMRFFSQTDFDLDDVLARIFKVYEGTENMATRTADGIISGRDHLADPSTQQAFIESLGEALAANPSAGGDQCKFWVRLLMRIGGSETRFLPTARPAIIVQAIRSLERFVTGASTLTVQAKTEVAQFYGELTKTEKEHFVDLVLSKKVFKASSTQLTQALYNFLDNLNSGDSIHEGKDSKDSRASDGKSRPPQRRVRATS